VLQLEIITVGKVKAGWIREGTDYYRKLLSRYAQIKFKSVKDSEGADSDAAAAKREEAGRLLSAVDQRFLVVALDKQGDQTSSEGLAVTLESAKLEQPRIQFLIGGAFGLDASVIERADRVLSLSNLTFPHELAFLILLEQLFRALSISAGSRYHK
jgi:23S rRNA (pseudouridine1915-N3)-methyltransferase